MARTACKVCGIKLFTLLNATMCVRLDVRNAANYTLNYLMGLQFFSEGTVEVMDFARSYPV